VGERESDKNNDTWLATIGCLDFYLLNNLDSIISLQIILFFFTKIRDFFFSINRDLDHFIWTQKKIKFFTLLISLLVFLLKF
jgi:hypothetical protein